MSEFSFEFREDELRLPSREQCLDMLYSSEYKLTKGRIQHVLNVNKIAEGIGKALKEARENINLDILDRASLLHDITKEAGDGNHAESGADLVNRNGWDEKMIEAIRFHNSDKALESKNWETKLLYYIDRRNDGRIGKSRTIDDWVSKKVGGCPEEKERYYEIGEKCKEFEQTLKSILSKNGNNLEDYFRE